MYEHEPSNLVTFGGRPGILVGKYIKHNVQKPREG